MAKDKILGVRPSIYIVGALIGILLSIVINWTIPYFAGWSYDIGYYRYLGGGMTITAVGGGIIMVLMSYLIGRKRPMLNLREAGFLISVLLTTSYFSGDGVRLTLYHMNIARPGQAWDEVSGIMPTWLAPSHELLNVWNAYMFGGPIDWSTWATPIMMWMIILTSYGLSQLFLGLIFRKLFVDIEMLPYPTTRILTETLKAGIASASERPILFTKRYKWYWLGFIIGLIFYIHTVIQRFIPGFPGLAYPGGSIKPWDEFNPQINAIIPGAQACLCFQPAAIALAYLCPVDILLSATVFSLIVTQQGIILAPTGLAPFDPAWDVWSIGTEYGYFSGMRNVVMFPGAVAGVALGIIIFRWRYIVNTIKAALGMKTSLDETVEPLRYRWLWIGFIVFSIINLVVFIGSGGSVLPIIAVFIFGILLRIAWCRMMGFMNWWMPGGYGDGVAHILGKYVPLKGTPALLTSVHNALWNSNNVGMWYSVTNTTVMTHKIGKELENSNKEIFVGNLIGTVMSFAIGVPIAFISFHIIGQANAKIYWGGGWANFGQPGFDWVRTGKYGWWSSGWEYFMLFGAIVSLILFFLKTKFIWWPLEPAMWALCLEWQQVMYWFPMLVALILKYLTIKVGGAKLYEGYGAKLAIGFCIAAYALLLIQLIIMALQAATIGLGAF